MIPNSFTTESGTTFYFYFGSYVFDPNSGTLTINTDNRHVIYRRVSNRKIIWDKDINHYWGEEAEKIKNAAQDYVRSRYLLAFS